MWVLLLILWLTAPLAELVVIVVLCLVNDERKRRIRKLEAELEQYGWRESGQTRSVETEGHPWQAPAASGEAAGQMQQVLVAGKKGAEELTASVESARRPVPEEVTDWQLQQIPAAAGKTVRPQPVHMAAGRNPSVAGKPQQAKSTGMGILALLAGVVFVVLAGLIFATTAWQILSNSAKVFLVLAFAGMFFGVSYLAEMRLHIHKTGNALYVLGSVFLFLSVLAAAYFQLLGPEYVLVGQNRWKVLWIGSLVTEIMLFGGVGRFRDRIYTRVCFGGMTVSMTFWALAHGLDRGMEWLSVMMGYAWLLMMGKWVLENRSGQRKQEDRDGRAHSLELLREEFSWFAPVHFWGFSIPVTFLGVISGMFVITPWLRWYPALALGAVLWGTGMQLTERDCEWKKIFFSLATAGTIHYLTAWIMFKLTDHQGVEEMGALVAAGMIVALGLLAGKRWRFRWQTETGEWVGMAFLLWDALLPGCRLLLAQMSGEGFASEILRKYAFLALAGALILTIMMAVWRKRSVLVQWVMPFFLWYVVLWPLEIWIRCELFHCLTESGADMVLGWLDRGMLGFLLLCGMIFWERRRQERYTWAILIPGTVMELVYFSASEITFPFFLLLAGYLLSEALREKREETGPQEDSGKPPVADRLRTGWKGIFQKRSWLCRAAALYAMMGVNHLMCPFTEDNRMIRLTGVIWVYVAGLVLERMLERERYTEKGRPVFWDICGSFLAISVIVEYYISCYDGMYLGVSGNGGREIWNLLLCLVVFAGFYLMFYLGKRIWPHLIISIAFMPLPMVLAWCYDWTENQWYLTVLGALLVTGAAARWCRRICEPAEEVSGGWRVDWFHIAAMFLLVLMAGMSEGGYWRFVCLIYLSVYVLQFGAIEEWRRAMWSGVGLLMVLAYWSQPFFDWPSSIELELWLLPVAGYLWYLGRVWRRRGEDESAGKGQEPAMLQTVGYVLCLLILTIHAWICSEVVNALILEGICLSVFVGALVKRCRFWIRMAGTILVLVALYMTKSFWLSISWWVYLLAAGIGLIVFAAVSEKRK